MQIDDLDPVAEGIVKVAAESGDQLEPVLLRDLLAHLSELRFVSHHDAEVPIPIRLQLLDFEDGDELMRDELEKRVSFTLIHLLKI